MFNVILLGVFVRAKTMTKLGYIDAVIGEAWGFLEVISWAKNLGVANVIIVSTRQR